MTISTDVSFKLTKYKIIKRAFTVLNKFGVDEEIPAEDFDLAGDFLNLLIKLWMDKGYNLWQKKIAYIFTSKGQSTYQITNINNDHATLAYTKTTVDSDGSAGDSSIVLSSVTGLSAGDYLGILLDDNNIFWTTVLSISGFTVNFALGGVLPSASSEGNIVFYYTTPLAIPLDVYQGVRTDARLSPDTDVPLNYLSFDEYIRLPNKTSTGIPVSYQYDRQLDNATIRLWLTPDASSYIIKLIIGERATNLDNNSDNVDYPDEWQLPMIYQLAVLLAPAYGKNKDAGFPNLKAIADEMLATALAFDNETASIYLKPNLHNA